MSGHWVFGRPFGYFVGTRKNNGNMYESRTVLVDEISDARIFNTRGAATRAGSDCGCKGEALEVSVALLSQQQGEG